MNFNSVLTGNLPMTGLEYIYSKSAANFSIPIAGFGVRTSSDFALIQMHFS